MGWQVFDPSMMNRVVNWHELLRMRESRRFKIPAYLRIVSFVLHLPGVGVYVELQVVIQLSVIAEVVDIRSGRCKQSCGEVS
jgi:hypothetical protein